MVSGFDNRVVSLLSTYSEAQPVGVAERWCREKKSKVNAAVTNVIEHYNNNWVELNSLIGLYRMQVKSKKLV